MNELSSTEAHDILQSYSAAAPAPDITSQLRAFGEMLLKENSERTASLDAKATNIVGYAGVILAFLIGQSAESMRSMNSSVRTLVFFSAVLAFIAICAAFISMITRHWDWFGDREWLHAEAISDPEVLKRYHIWVMHRVNSDHRTLNDSKAASLVAAQAFVAVGTACLALALAFHILPAWVSGPS